MYFNQGSYFYYIVLALNIYCVIHMIRRGTVNRWIWLVILGKSLSIRVVLKIPSREGVCKPCAMVGVCLYTMQSYRFAITHPYSRTFPNAPPLDSYRVPTSIK